VMSCEVLLHFVWASCLVITLLALVWLFVEVNFLVPDEVTLLYEGLVTSGTNVLSDVQVTLHVAF
jgi:hypothetical protein